jgi:hypothetical protein
MTEFEFIFWIIIIENGLQAEIKKNVIKLIRYSAYTAKKLSNKSISSFEAVFEAELPNFVRKANNWILKYYYICNVTPQQINSKYEFLSKAVLSQTADLYINYSQIVEELVKSWMKG